MRVLVPCPAKLNLFLAVGPRDEIGYHPIRTVFQAISLFDELVLEDTGGETRITSNSPDLPQENTVTKALRLLAETAPVPPLRIHLEKRIPSGAGLGGGSSDAAGLIRAINRFLESPLDDDLLFDVAYAVGADVPFFLVGGRAKGEGYGEKITPLPPVDEHYVVVKPAVGVSSGEAYARLDRICFPFREFSEAGLYNDFERVAPCESLDLIEKLLSLGARDAGLTGSGSAVFGRTRSELEAENLAGRLIEEGHQAWTAQTLAGLGEIQVSR